MLSSQEQQWLLARRVTRLTDKKEVQIYPMGAERFLSAVLAGRKPNRYDLRTHITDKRVLVIPGFANSGFLLAQAGSKSVAVYDRDPVTIAWVKAFKCYYHYRESDHYPSIGMLLDALLCWYPPVLHLPNRWFSPRLHWLLNPQGLRRAYIFYMLSLVQTALRMGIKQTYEFEYDLQFHVGSSDSIVKASQKSCYDVAFVPYLLGVKNGVETEQGIVTFMRQLMQAVPDGSIVVNPTRNTKEFYLWGKRYFTTTSHPSLQSIPELKPYCVADDPHWFGTQGLAVFHSIYQTKIDQLE